MSVSIYTQPSQYGITYVRSPVVYRYIGCTSTNNYVFNILISTGTTSSLINVYASINRKTDIDNGITIDASYLLQNYIKNNLEYNNENVVYFKSVLQEFLGSTLVNTYTSNIAIGTLGYTTYAQGGYAQFNLTDEYDNTDYLMNYMDNNTITLPNYSYNNSYVLNWRYNGVASGYTLSYDITSNFYQYSISFSDCSGDTHQQGVYIYSPYSGLTNKVCKTEIFSYNFIIDDLISITNEPIGLRILSIYDSCNEAYSGVTSPYFLPVNWIDYRIARIESSLISFGTKINAKDEVKQIAIGYNDLMLYDLPEIATTFNVNIYLSGTSILKQYTINPDNCNGNDLINIMYMNKWGVWDHFYFKGRKTTQIDTTYEIYKYNKINNSTMTYNIGDGSYHKFISNGKEKMILNSGWLTESDNLRFKDLLLSESVLYDSIYPMIITSKSQTFKTVRFDKMINYTLELEYAYDSINNII